jgi:hypothetical protein
MANSYLRFPNNFFMGTRMLTLEERGAFNDLLDLYLARDGDLPDHPRQRAYDLAIDQRIWSRIRKQLIEAGKIEIKDGIILPTGGDKTLARCLARSLAAADAANRRWRKNGAKVPILNETPDAEADATAMLLKTRHVLDTNVSNNIPKNEISLAVELYNSFAKKHALPIAKKITKTRTQKIKARLKDAGGIDGWKNALDKVAMNPWLLGDNDRGWKADLDFLCQEKSFTKLMEGSYDQPNNHSDQKTDSPGGRGGNASIASSIRRFIDGAGS